jgi:NAD-dependent SIR2 family protein deacetylase
VLHCQLIASLAKRSALANPTTFHHFLRALDNRGLLLRVYTQNIDGLELKAGLHTSIELDEDEDPPVRCIPLHGTLDELRCQGCGSISKLEAYYQCLKDGRLPECSQCQENAAERAKRGKRPTRVHSMRPNIILYNETHPQGDEIAEVQKKDIPEIDFLLVVGTSLTVSGTATLVRQFSKALHDKFPTKNLESPRVIFLNDTFSNPSSWKGTFDGWVETDCQEFAKKGLAKVEKEWLDNHCGSEAKGFLYADRCFSSRPSWRL